MFWNERYLVYICTLPPSVLGVDIQIIHTISEGLVITAGFGKIYGGPTEEEPRTRGLHHPFKPH
jgi:hypothetical protein